MSSRPRARTAAARRGDRGRRTPCSDRASAGPAASQCGRRRVSARRSSSHRRASPSRRRNCIDRAQRVPRRHVPHVHRRGAVLEHDDVEAGAAEAGATPRGRASASDQRGAREHDAQPERQIAKQAPALAHRRDADLAQPPQIGRRAARRATPTAPAARAAAPAARGRPAPRTMIGPTSANTRSRLSPCAASCCRGPARDPTSRSPKSRRRQDLELFGLDLGRRSAGEPVHGRAARQVGRLDRPGAARGLALLPRRRRLHLADPVPQPGDVLEVVGRVGVARRGLENAGVGLEHAVELARRLGPDGPIVARRTERGVGGDEQHVGIGGAALR